MSSLIYLKDNNCGVSNVLEKEKQYDDISHIVNKTIEEVLDENPAFVFPKKTFSFIYLLPYHLLDLRRRAFHCLPNCWT